MTTTRTGDGDVILVVDDDQHVLSAMQRLYRSVFRIETADSALAALERIRGGERVAVLVSDDQMPGMAGRELMQRVEALAPDTVRVMLASSRDDTTAVQAVSEGRIFRYLSKPCSPATFASCMRASLEQYRVRTSERALLQETVTGCVEILTEVLALTNPWAFGRASRVRDYARALVELMGLPDRWDVETAALLSQLGFVAIPPTIVDRLALGHELEPQQRALLHQHPQLAQSLLERVPRLARVAAIIGLQMAPDLARIEPEPLRRAVEVLVAALLLDDHLTVDASLERALDSLRGSRRGWSSGLLAAVARLRIGRRSTLTALLSVRALREGMVLDGDASNTDGTVLIASGQTLSQSHILRLTNHARLGGVIEPIRVRVISNSLGPVAALEPARQDSEL